MERLPIVGGVSDRVRNHSPSRDEGESKQGSKLGHTQVADAIEGGALIEHNEFIGRVTSVEGGVIHGRIANIRYVVSFEAATANGLKTAFEESVSAYLAVCETKRIEPRMSYSGNLRV